MGDVIVIEEGNTRWVIEGLHTTGTLISRHARRMSDQLDERVEAAASVLADFEGDVARSFLDQSRSVHGALAVVCQIIAEAADVCLRFPGPGSAPFPEVIPLAEPPRGTALSANPPVLRAFAGASVTWDEHVEAARDSVTLDGVSATISFREQVFHEGEPPTWRWTDPEPTNPASLVTLPDPWLAAHNMLALSEGAASIASLTAKAVDEADYLAGPRPRFLPSEGQVNEFFPGWAGEPTAAEQLTGLVGQLAANGGRLTPFNRAAAARPPRALPVAPTSNEELRRRVVARSAPSQWSEWEESAPHLFETLNLSGCAYVLCYQPGETQERSRTVRLTLDDGSFADVTVIEKSSTFRVGLGVGIHRLSIVPDFTTREFRESMGRRVTVDWQYNDVEQCLTSDGWERTMQTREDNQFMDWLEAGEERFE